jgi:salicylate hydroxylase
MTYVNVSFRDGRSGVIVKQTHPPAHVAPHQAPCRVHRGKLQKALLREANQNRIRTGAKLSNVERLPCGKLRLIFSDGLTSEVDLLIGADGIRSVSESYSIIYSHTTDFLLTIRPSEASPFQTIPSATQA